MSFVTVTDTPVPVYSTNTEVDLFGQNTGLVPLYLSELTDVSPTNNSLILTPGTPFTWPKGKQLYAVADPNATGSITYTNNGASMGVGTVTAKNANAVTLIAEANLAVAAGAGIYGPNLIRDLDVSQFASIIIVYTVVAPVMVATGGNYIDAYQYFSYAPLVGAGYPFAFVPGSVVDIFNPQFSYCTGANGEACTVQLPVTAQYFHMENTVTVGGFGNTSTLNIKVLGSSETISEPKYVNQGDSLEEGIPKYGIHYKAFGAGLGGAYMMASKNGEAIISQVNASGPGGRADFYYWEDGTPLVFLAFLSSGTPGDGVVKTVKLPMRPIRVVINPVAGADNRLTIAQ